MNPWRVSLMILAAAATMSAQPAAAVRPAPQPRLRLDPNRQTVLAEPAQRQPRPVAGDAIAMDPVIVKEAPVPAAGPARPEGSRDPFTWASGGRIAAKDIGRVRIEAGVWPYVDVIDHPAHPGAGEHVGVDFLRVSW